MDAAAINYENFNIIQEHDTLHKSEGIGILVDMARSGKIDPWNIDIVDVTGEPIGKTKQYKRESTYKYMK